MKVAKANDIKYAPTECHHEGDCSGTCPKCEAEVRWLEQQLQLRRQLGKAVAVVGVSMGLAALTACEGKTAPPNSDNDSLSILAQTFGFPDSVPDTMLIARQAVKPENSVPVQGEVLLMPSFPGDQQALLNFLNENVKFPEQAMDVCFSGRVVVSFIVETDGSITNPEIARGIHPLLDAEALRVVKLMPKWEPGTKNGTPVKVRYNLPINFKLEEPSSLPTDTSKDN